MGCGYREGSGKIVSQNKQRWCRFDSKPTLLWWWCFDSKPILLWLQLYFEATGNFVLCLQLSNLKLGLELKQKLRWWSFDSKPILLWLQLYFDATGNFVLCLQLSKLNLGLELKQKFAPKPLFLNNSNPPYKCEKIPSLRLWNLRGWRNAVASVQGSCFNSQFWNEGVSNNLVVSVLRL